MHVKAFHSFFLCVTFQWTENAVILEFGDPISCFHGAHATLHSQLQSTYRLPHFSDSDSVFRRKFVVR